MAGTVFIETTIPSYYVARPSRNLVQLARQELTREWWDVHRSFYQLFTSQAVVDEIGEGDPAAASYRLRLLEGVPVLEVDEYIIGLADELVRDGIVPDIAARDAIHISCSAVHRMQFLLTWNCKHIANPHIRKRLRACFSRHRIDLPVICTPEEFIGDEQFDPSA